MKNKKLMLPLAMLLCALCFSVVNAKNVPNGLKNKQKQKFEVPYSLGYLAKLGYKRTVTFNITGSSEIELEVPESQTGFRDWEVTLYQGGNLIYTFYTWFTPNFSFTSDWNVGYVTSDTYDVYVQCMDSPDGGYYADVFWDCTDSNNVDQNGGDQNIYTVFEDPYYFGSIDIASTLSISTSCNR